jgi:hypothetical protein
MPAVSEKQRGFMDAELSRKRAGKKTRTGMNEGQLEDYARNPRGESARQQLRGLERYEPPESGEDLDRMAARRKKKKRA